MGVGCNRGAAIVSGAEATLFAVSGSVVAEPTVAVLVTVCPMRSADGRTVITRSRLSPAAKAPTAQVTSCPAAVQPALAATNSSPVGEGVADLHRHRVLRAVVAHRQPEGGVRAGGHRRGRPGLGEHQVRERRGRRERYERDQSFVVGEVGLEAEGTGVWKGVARKREIVDLGAGAVGRQGALDRDHAVLTGAELGDLAADDREPRRWDALALAGRVVLADAGPTGDRDRRGRLHQRRPAGCRPSPGPPFPAHRCGR